jgi:hypothetical protein
MQLHITNQTSIAALRDEFQSAFPFLKLECYAQQHQEGEGSAPNQQLDHTLTLGSIRQNNHEGVLQLHPDMKVAELEEKFRNEFGLAVQVFRKSGAIWLQTMRTDEWSLAEQNNKGKEGTVHEENAEPDDYREQL